MKESAGMVAGLVWFEFFGAVVIYSVFFNGPRSPTKIHPQLRNLRKIPPPPETSEMITGCLRKIHLNSEISEKYTPNSEISEKYLRNNYGVSPKNTPQLRDLRKIYPKLRNLRKIYPKLRNLRKIYPNSEKYTPSSEISENNTPPPETSETNMPLLR